MMKHPTIFPPIDAALLDRLLITLVACACFYLVCAGIGKMRK